MPKQRITKEMVIDAAFQLAREEGMEQVLVKRIAQRLGCSVQPVYSYCDHMDGVRREVEKKTTAFVRDYLAARTEEENLFHSFGAAHVRLAREEPHLYQIYYRHTREGIAGVDDLYRREANQKVVPWLREKLGLKEEAARTLYFSMMLLTLGMGTLLATTRPGIPEEQALERLDGAYRLLLAGLERRRGEKA